MSNNLKPGQVLIHGKVYDTVARRLALFREQHPEWTLKTKVVVNTEHRVLVKASLYDEGFRLIATGHAEEERGSDAMTETSAIEICETSAVGRCLAMAMWPGSETEFDPQVASADEVTHAIRKQQDKTYGDYMALVHEHWESIVAIKQFLSENNLDAAMEAWREIGQGFEGDQHNPANPMIKLWRAPTKGGIFTTKERNMLKGDA
jgi:hypothetical protein